MLKPLMAARSYPDRGGDQIRKSETKRLEAHDRKPMEKKEARIKCSGCGASYKLKIPVTDKPVSFKCKKCGKVLKLKVKPSEEGYGQAEESSRPPEFETTQLPDAGNYQDRRGAPPRTASFIEGHEFVQAGVTRPAQPTAERQWMILTDELIKGPFTKTEVVQMIKAGEVSADTSIRMGERPWLKASEVSDFRDHFPESVKKGAAVLDTISLLEKEEPVPEGQPTAAFIKRLPEVATYPVANPVSLGIFAAVTFVSSTVFSLDILIGFPLSLLVWILLYGYLSELMSTSMRSSSEPPPAWDFGKVKQMVDQGLGVFLVFLVYTVAPVLIILLGVVYCFLNGQAAIGYALIGLIVIAFVCSLFLVPACLVNLLMSRNKGISLNPGLALFVVKKGGRPYMLLAAVSIVLGLACLFVAYAGHFLSIAIDFGFVVSGLLMAVVLSYTHFVWFHVLGMFAGENREVLKRP